MLGMSLSVCCFMLTIKRLSPSFLSQETQFEIGFGQQTEQIKRMCLTLTFV